MWEAKSTSGSCFSAPSCSKLPQAARVHPLGSPIRTLQRLVLRSDRRNVARSPYSRAYRDNSGLRCLLPDVRGRPGCGGILSADLVAGRAGRASRRGARRLRVLCCRVVGDGRGTFGVLTGEYTIGPIQVGHRPSQTGCAGPPPLVGLNAGQPDRRRRVPRADE